MLFLLLDKLPRWPRCGPRSSSLLQRLLEACTLHLKIEFCGATTAAHNSNDNCSVASFPVHRTDLIQVPSIGQISYKWETPFFSFIGLPPMLGVCTDKHEHFAFHSMLKMFRVRRKRQNNHPEFVSDSANEKMFLVSDNIMLLSVFSDTKEPGEEGYLLPPQLASSASTAIVRKRFS